MKLSLAVILSFLSAVVIGFQKPTSAVDGGGISSVQINTSRTSEAELQLEFFRLCDSAMARIRDKNRSDPFFIDSYGVRGLCVAYDMTGNRKYLDACQSWSDRMVEYQKLMVPAGAYYMNYGRKPGEDVGDWYVADCSSIALAVLATAVRCRASERERLLHSVEQFASMVSKDFTRPSGGVTDGLWPQYNGPWWCSSALFGSLSFMLYRGTGDRRYLNIGLDIVNWLNKLDLARVGPLPLSHQGPSMPMYVLECYSAGWPYITKDNTVKKGAIEQVSWCLRWIRNQEKKPVFMRKWQPANWWGAKYGGLPFHQYIYSRYFRVGRQVSAEADLELRRLAKIVFAENLNAPQLEMFMLMSYAERLNPGAIYRGMKNY
ncbi:MAG: hypothetical protein ACP5US_12725 [Candidatus Kryptoniota bacterium]